MSTPTKVIEIATAYAKKGYKEGKNNDTIFGKWYGLNFNPWCAMFVSYVFHEAGVGHLVAAQNAKGFASCSAGWSWFKKRGAEVKVEDAKPGDIVFMAFDGNLKDADHVGIVTRNDVKGKTLHTVEGNTPQTGGNQANGEGVYLKKRPYGLIVAVVRPAWDNAGKKESPIKVKPVVKKAVAAVKPKPSTYTVKAGDSYWSIAEKHGLNYVKLQQLNANEPLHPGDVIKLK